MARNTTIISTDSLIPFWLQANRHGKIAAAGNLLNLTEVGIFRNETDDFNKSFHWMAGTHLVANAGKNGYLQLNRAYAGISLNNWQLKGGMFYDPVKYAGLSTTNGNLARSGNARPYPMIRIINFRILSRFRLQRNGWVSGRNTMKDC